MTTDPGTEERLAGLEARLAAAEATIERAETIFRVFITQGAGKRLWRAFGGAVDEG